MNITFETAVALLKKDDIVAIPTETVYGLAARYNCDTAIEKIFETKQRPKSHPLIVHINDKKWLETLAIDIPHYAYRLIDFFWPGPLTLVFKKSESVSNKITANQDTVAIRLPNHNMLLELIKSVGAPFVAPSANLFCKTSPTKASHVENNFNHTVPVLDGGECAVGIESTIISCVSPNEIILLRPGVISQSEIEKIAGVRVTENNDNQKTYPGSHAHHYQPNKKIFFYENKKNIHDFLNSKNKKFFYILLQDRFDESDHTIFMPNNPKDYASRLYAIWQSIQDAEIDSIVIEMPPNTDEWQGVRNRIEKAGSSIYLI